MRKWWKKSVVFWRMGRDLYLSVPFTWLLPEARVMAQKHKTGKVFAGGPAVSLMPELLADVADIETPCPVSPLAMHNPLATFTSRGCVRKCPFCAVPKIEGEFRELDNWEPRPLVCDNNLLAARQAHFDKVIDRLKPLPYVDFNQGLDCRLFKPYHASRMGELKAPKLRFAFDHAKEEGPLADALELCWRYGLKDIGVYVLIGFDDTPDDARYRLEWVRSKGIRPNPMRYQPLDAMGKNMHISPNWTGPELARYMKYYASLRYLEHVPFDEFRPPAESMFDMIELGR